MKKLVLIFLFICCSFSLFASSGLLSGEKNLRVSKTQWFDLIYPERCEKTAAILYENADTIYEEVTQQYGISPSARIPVVITPAVESLNAFWAVLPYSHIVLYDTSYDSMNELTVFSESLLSIFRHELTHAVTFTMKNGFWNSMTGIFGDAFNIGPILVSSGMAEGATLTSESAGGEGRLNDEYAKHDVKQAKIENKFPAYYGAQGAGDLNPYYFNGAFHEWLQNKYGMEAYARFWYYTINVQGLTVRWRFKKAFGVKLDAAWKQFIQDYEIPDVAANPVQSGEATDFFAPEAETYSRNNDAGSLYESLTSSSQNLYWIDSSQKAVFKSSKKLMNLTGVYNVSPSADDSVLALSCYADNSSSISAKIKLYSARAKQLYTVKENGLKDGAIFQKDDSYYLVASKFESPENTIHIYKIVMNDKGRITGTESVSKIVLPLNVFAASYVPVENGFAYIEKDKLTYSICIADWQGQVVNRITVPEEKMVVHSLSATGNNFYFSWAKPGTMPRLGMLNLDTKEFSLSQKDLSGGVYSPVKWGQEIVYIGRFLNQNRILKMDSQDDFEISGAIVSNQLTKEENQEQFTQEYEIPESEKLNCFKYLTRGLWLPVSIYETEYFGPNYGAVKQNDVALGVSYMTGMPWSTGTSDSLIFTGGWNFIKETAGLELIANSGTSTSLLANTATIKTEFDSKGWKFSSASLSTSSSFHFGKTSMLQVKNVIDGKSGRQSIWLLDKDMLFSGYSSNENPTIYYNFSDDLSLAYSNVHFAGPGLYEKAGVTVQIGGIYLLDGAYSSDQGKIDTGDLYGGIKGFIPKLLPLESKYGFTYNLPSTVSFKVLTTASKTFSVFEANGEAILFGTLIKRPLPLINGIYLQNWKISSGYTGAMAPETKNLYSGVQFLHLPDYVKEFASGQFIYTDSAYLKADLVISPNMGALARNEFQADIYGLVTYVIRNIESKSYFNVNFGVNISY